MPHIHNKWWKKTKGNPSSPEMAFKMEIVMVVWGALHEGPCQEMTLEKLHVTSQHGEAVLSNVLTNVDD